VSDVSASAETSTEALVAEIVDAFMAQLAKGEQPSVEDYARRHPAIADVLRKVLPALQVLEPPTGPFEDGAPLTVGVLGDFRILRELGRGGMGVVYEAEQVSLCRRVALKVLPFAATMDPRHLQRFQNEALAAASLEHPHIVPVYGVGCERGVHYYAMKFIDGQSLAEVIDELKNAKEMNHRGTETTERNQKTAMSSLCSLCLCGSKDFFKTIAELGIQAAEALEHAHSVGIVHRDIKPANLMIDGQGKLWITDFGLARTASDAGLTMTGDVLGTLRYMSPEQAMAKHGLVDHRTDVYSLGVTLYELLTRKPAVDGRDREQILNAITLEDSQPPRSVDASIPRDLETIVLKAMAKTPSERYATARELADDLRRFQEARPIQARRPTLIHRTVKWGRRHRTLVWMTTIFLALLSAGLAISVFLIWREHGVTKAALVEAQTNYTRAEGQRRRAENNFRQAFWAVEDLLKPFEPGHNLQPLTLAEVKRFQTAECLRLLAVLSEDASDEPAARLQRGVAYIHTGRVYQVQGDHEKAQKAFRQGIEIFDRLVQDFPDESAYPSELGQAWGILAEDLYRAGNPRLGNDYFCHALSIYREAVRNHPADPDLPWWLARALCGWLDPKLRNFTEAVELAQKAVQLAPDHPRSWMILGIAYYRTGQWAAAVNALQENLQRTPAWPGGLTTRGRPAIEALLFLAMAQWQCGKHEEASKTYGIAIGIMEMDFSARDLEERAARAEAAALLGIKEPPSLKAKEEAPGNK
jgi:serine/threonine protein kinase